MGDVTPLDWRFERDTTRGKFSVLIGGFQWATELTEKEWIDFTELLNDLEYNYLLTIEELLPGEHIQLELERGVYWAELEGDSTKWSVSFIISSEEQRAVEGYWPHPASGFVLSEMRKELDNI